MSDTFPLANLIKKSTWETLAVAAKLIRIRTICPKDPRSKFIFAIYVLTLIKMTGFQTAKIFKHIFIDVVYINIVHSPD